MINNKFFIVILLCIGLSSHTAFTAEQPQSGWRSLASSAYNRAYNTGASLWQSGTQKLSQIKNYAASFIPQSVKDAVNKWSTQKKIVVFTAIVGALASIYNKDAILQMTSDAFNKASSEQIGGISLGMAGLSVIAGAKSASDLYYRTVQTERNKLNNMPNISINQKLNIVNQDLKKVDNFYGTTPELSRPPKHSPAQYQAQRSALLTVKTELVKEREQKMLELPEKLMLLESLIPKGNEGS